MKNNINLPFSISIIFILIKIVHPFEQILFWWFCPCCNLLKNKINNMPFVKTFRIIFIDCGIEI